MGYLSNFIVYMLAMIGVIMIALFVFKQTNSVKLRSSACKGLKITDSLSIGARKVLYVVAAGNEKFLIAGDADRTTLISKLNSSDDEQYLQQYDIKTENSFKETISALHTKPVGINKTNLGIKTIQNSPYDSVMKSLAEKMRG